MLAIVWTFRENSYAVKFEFTGEKHVKMQFTMFCPENAQHTSDIRSRVKKSCSQEKTEAEK